MAGSNLVQQLAEVLGSELRFDGSTLTIEQSSKPQRATLQRLADDGAIAIDFDVRLTTDRLVFAVIDLTLLSIGLAAIKEGLKDPDSSPVSDARRQPHVISVSDFPMFISSLDQPVP